MSVDVKDMPTSASTKLSVTADSSPGSEDVQAGARRAYQLLSTQLSEALRQHGALATVVGSLLNEHMPESTHELAAIAERLRGLQDSLAHNLRMSAQRLETIRPVVFSSETPGSSKGAGGKDPLTGVGDREVFERAVEMEAARFSRYSTPYSLALLDIDHFALCNERHGRKFADDVLRCYANNLSLLCRKNDVIARLDGDRFALVFANTNCAGAVDAMAKAQKLLSQVSLPQAMQSVLMPSYSAGITGCRAGEGVLQLIGRAQAALQRAKDLGRNRIETDE